MALPQIEVCAIPVLDAALLNQPYTVLLHSSPNHPLGEWSFLAQDPWQVAIVRGTTIDVWNPTGHTTYTENPWRVLEALWQPWQQIFDPRHPCPGGVFGYLGYEFDSTLRASHHTAWTNLPDAVLGWYRSVIAWRTSDTHAWRGTCVAAPCEVVLPKIELPAVQPLNTLTALDQKAYVEKVEHILDYINAGDIYQANLTFHLQKTAQCPPYSVYQALQKRTHAPFGAWIRLPDATIMSASPERFLWCDATGYVETRPIKGTRPRGITVDQDTLLAQELQTNTKERAENLMITDLLRNDLGKVCQIGSVKVPALWSIERLPTVHHLVSTVTGQLKSDISPWQLLAACWPGGSITGAPKKRAREIIAELEIAKREVYCGTLGYWGFNRTVNTSIVIRTLIERDNLYTCGVGCGIVADSDPLAEYAEALLKGAALISALDDCECHKA